MASLRTIVAWSAALTCQSFLQAHAQQTPNEDGLWVSAGAAQRLAHAEIKGVLRGNIAPQTPFASKTNDTGVSYSVGVGYNHRIGENFFVGPEASIDTFYVDNKFAPVATNASVTQFVDTCFPPPPFAPPGTPCVSFGSFTRAFSENALLHAKIDRPYSANLNARAGYSWGAGSVWVTGGLAAEQVKLSYQTPSLNTFQTPIPLGVIVGIQPLPTLTSSLPAAVVLPAEERSQSKTLVGWNASVGLSYHLGPMSLSASYVWADYGEADFQDGQRVTGLRAITTARTVKLSLTAPF